MRRSRSRSPDSSSRHRYRPDRDRDHRYHDRHDSTHSSKPVDRPSHRSHYGQDDRHRGTHDSHSRLDYDERRDGGRKSRDRSRDRRDSTRASFRPVQDPQRSPARSRYDPRASESRTRERDDRITSLAARDESHIATPELSMNEPDEQAAGEEAENDTEAQMAALMGFGGFGSTKGTKVQGNPTDVVVGKPVKKTEYRQYMNRKGGFNRPLDAVSGP